MKFTFNKKTSEVAYHDVEWNRMFVKQEELYFNRILKVRGYVYLNQIYEAFGIKWDPVRENKCFTCPSDIDMRFDMIQVNENGFDINITCKIES